MTVHNIAFQGIADASLLAPLALPAQHPAYNRLQVPATTATDLEIWKQRPCVQWVREMYRRHR